MEAVIIRARVIRRCKFFANHKLHSPVFFLQRFRSYIADNILLLHCYVCLKLDADPYSFHKPCQPILCRYLLQLPVSAGIPRLKFLP